eukprot:Skav215413  [mRNA]  locus=scaffold356:294693:296865:+ [translate_table: standard]
MFGAAASLIEAAEDARMCLRAETLLEMISKATCRSQILTAQAVEEDIGTAAAAQCGISVWGKGSLHHSEEHVQRVTAKQGTKLDVPISSLIIENVEVPWISARDWVEWLVKKGLWPRLAGARANDYNMAGQIWTHFWNEFEKTNPDFEVFTKPFDRAKTAAFLIHGDEGRTLKRHAILVTSLQSCLGQGFDNKRLPQRVNGQWTLKVNFIGHSFTHRFVTSTIPKTHYETNPELFHKMMEKLAESLKDLFDVGVFDPVTRETFRVVVIGVKGDAPYLAKCGKFYRSYNTTVKRGTEQSVPKGVCHRCLAGTIGFPCEELATMTPKWLGTQGVRMPWLSTPPVVEHLMHSISDPATFFHSDVWHVVHLGFGRSWVASVLGVTLEVINEPNLERKWAYLTDEYRSWCRSNRTQTHINAITPYLMSYGDKTGTMGQWHKGALTTTFMKWLPQLLGKLSCDPRGLLPECKEATSSLNGLFGILYRADAFLTTSECERIVSKGMNFISTYAKMARAQYQAGKPWNFPLYPKLHVFHECLLTIHADKLRCGIAANPLLFSCQVDEDQIGRSSRLSRRVNPRFAMLRTLERFLIAANTAYTQAGLIRAGK